MDILEKLDLYKGGTASHGWRKLEGVYYENDYISLVRIDSSNKWLPNKEMGKQWSLIVKQKQDFSSLPNFIFLKNRNILSVTSVRRGANAGCIGIRLYEMSKDPAKEIIIDLLDFIFDNR